MPEGLFIIRAAIGLLLFAHGTQKLFGWFGGYGLDGTGGFFESVGHRPGRRMAMIAGGTEAVGGLFLVIGLLTPWAAAMVIGTDGRRRGLRPRAPGPVGHQRWL